MFTREHSAIRAALAAAALALSGCAAQDEGSIKDNVSQPAGIAPIQRIRGEALIGKDGYGFTPCGSDRQRILVLVAPARDFLERFLEPGGKPEFFVDAWAREKEGKLEVVGIERAYTEGPRCGAAREEVQFVARGTEPFWSLQVAPSGWQLQRPDQPLLSVTGVPIKQGPAYAWSSVSPEATVEIVPGYCADGMADAASAWQARVSVGELRLSGCAYRGELRLP
ncbi:MAG: hypothetical protein ABWY94_07045 [Pseudoxanthomonas sp.]